MENKGKGKEKETSGNVTEVHEDAPTRDRCQFGIGFQISEATWMTAPSAFDGLWGFSNADMRSFVNHPDGNFKLAHKFEEWAGEAYKWFSAADYTSDLITLLGDMEKAVGHDCERHSAPWELRTLREMIRTEGTVTDVTVALYNHITVLFLQIYVTVRVGCVRDAKQAGEGLPWHKILGRDFHQHVKTKWYIQQIARDRPGFLKQFMQGRFLAPRPDTVSRAKRTREDTDSEAAGDESMVVSRREMRNMRERVRALEMAARLRD